MSKLFASLCLALFCAGYVSGYLSDDYALHFPNKGITDYASIWGMPSLAQFTVCFWIKTSDSKGTPFSYAVPTNDNELLVDFSGSFMVTINGKVRRPQVSANDGKWHHICATWRNSDGELNFYKDGELKYQTKNFKTNYIIKAEGSLMLGQEQDGVFSKLDPNQSLRGSLAGVNVWDRVKSPAEIEEYSSSCRCVDAGNVYQWSDFRDAIRGNTVLVIPSPCSPPE